MCFLPPSRVMLLLVCAVASFILCYSATPNVESTRPNLSPASRELLDDVRLPPGPSSPQLPPTTATSLEITTEPEWEPPEPPAPKSTILPNSPQFIVRLPDNNLLCFAIEGYELFTYNLITSNYLVLNGFLNLTTIPEENGISQIRGFGDVGMIIKAVDRRVKQGKRFFKHLIYGEKKKAIMHGFGEVDLNKGAISFSLQRGHTNIESQQSQHEQFRVTLDKPQTDIVIVSQNGHTFNVYVEDSTGLLGIDIHGLIGQFFHSKVRISTNYKELHLSNNKVVLVHEGPVWRDSGDSYSGKTCWYPQEGEKIIQGEPWEYVVEHIMSTHYKHSLFKK